MHKETFRLKQQPSQPKGLSNRGPARCPFDDEETEQVLIRDILLTVVTTMVLSTGVLGTAACGYMLLNKLGVMTLSADRLVLGSLAGLTIAAVFTIVCAFVYLCGVLHTKDPEINTCTLAIMSGFTALLAASSGTMATISRAKILLTTTITGVTSSPAHLLDSDYKTQLLTALTSSMRRSPGDEVTRTAWDVVQTAWKCCGVNNATDWLELQGVIPASCCRSEFCPGCVDAVATDVASVSSSTAATSFILTVVMFVSSVACVWLWKTKGQLLKSPPTVYSIEIISVARPSNFELHECSSMMEYPSADSLSIDSLREEEMHVRYYNNFRK